MTDVIEALRRPLAGVHRLGHQGDLEAFHEVFGASNSRPAAVFEGERVHKQEGTATHS